MKTLIVIEPRLDELRNIKKTIKALSTLSPCYVLDDIGIQNSAQLGPQTWPGKAKSKDIISIASQMDAPCSATDSAPGLDKALVAGITD